MDNDLKFLTKQIGILSKKLPIGLKGEWTIHWRGQEVKRNVRVIQELKEEKTPGWGQKLLHLSLWGLYLTPQIHSFANFATQSYKAWNTGESPLKESADIMSEIAFARHSNELPLKEQQEAVLEMSYIQGILSGYIPFSEFLVNEYPALATYLEPLTIDVALQPKGEVISPDTAVFIPMPILTANEANRHAMRFLGQQVREHYKSTGKQLSYENPNINLSAWNQDPYVPPEEQPTSVFTILGEECVEAIHEAKSGVLPNESIKLKNLQNHIQTIFGTPLPMKWFETWIFSQEWHEDRLEHFQDWIAQNLEMQARKHISQQNIHEHKTPSTSAPKSFADLPAAFLAEEESSKSESELVIETRHIEPLQEFQDPIDSVENMVNGGVFTSSTSMLSSPASVALNVYNVFCDQIKNFYNDQLLPLVGDILFVKKTWNENSDKLLLHQFGDFFGKNTGLEGRNPIQAFEFYRDLLSTLLLEQNQDSQYLQEVQNLLDKLDQAISLTKILYSNVNEFQSELEQALKKLSPNESVFLPGGWAGPQGGHAMVYEIIKLTENSFSFRLYNRGMGSEHHFSVLSQLKNKILPFVEITNIPLESLLERPFLLAWQKIITVIPIQKRWESHDIYQSLIQNLKGEISTIHYGEQDLMSPQRSGTCTFASLHALFHHLNIDKKISQKIRFGLLTSGLNHYVKWNKHRLSTDSQAQNLFSKSLEEYSRIIVDMHEKEILTDAELKSVSERTKEFKQLLQSGINDYQKGIEKRASTLEFNSKASPGELIKIPAISFITAETAIALQNYPLFTLPLLKGWQPKQERIIHDLSIFVKAFKEGTGMYSSSSLLLEMQTLIQKLDFSEMTLNKEESAQIINQLHSLGLILYENRQLKCLEHKETSELILPKVLLNFNNLLFHASSLLNKHYPGASEELFYNLFSQNPGVYFMDPKLDEQYTRLHTHSVQSMQYSYDFNEKNEVFLNFKIKSSDLLNQWKEKVVTYPKDLVEIYARPFLFFRQGYLSVRNL